MGQIATKRRKRRIESLYSCEDSSDTLLYQAALQGDLDEVQNLLINPDTDVNAPNESGWTALHVACAHHNSFHIIQLLLQYGADPNADPDRTGDRPLHIAVWQTRKCSIDEIHVSVAIVKLLLDAKAEVNATNKHGETPLHVACAHHDTEIVELLLASGADPNAICQNWNTPLYIAARNLASRNEDNQNEPLKIMKLLLQHGAEPNGYVMSAQGKQHDVRTPLCWAVHSKNLDAIALLLQYGADSNVEIEYNLDALYEPSYIPQVSMDYWDYAYPLYWCRALSDIRILRMLFEAGLDINSTHVMSRTQSQLTLIQIAVQEGFPEATDMLMAMGCDMSGVRQIMDNQATQAHFKDHPFVLAQLCQQASNPFSLMVLARRQIHRCVSASKIQGAKEDLPLPTLLKQYVDYAEYTPSIL